MPITIKCEKCGHSTETESPQHKAAGVASAAKRKWKWTPERIKRKNAALRRTLAAKRATGVYAR